MSLRCSCSDHGDDTVFGPCYKCSPEPEAPRSHLMDPPPLIPSWVFTVPAEEPAEPRYMETLDADERGGR